MWTGGYSEIRVFVAVEVDLCRGMSKEDQDQDDQMFPLRKVKLGIPYQGNQRQEMSTKMLDARRRDPPGYWPSPAVAERSCGLSEMS